MTTFAYTTGNPNNLSAGQGASMIDIQGPLVDLKAFLNGATIDATNLATSAKPATLLAPYQTVGDGGATAAVGTLGVTTYMPTNNGSVTWVSNGTANGVRALYVDPANFTVSGLTTRFRLVSHIANGAAAMTGETLTFGLYPLNAPTGTGATFQYTVGTVVSGSTQTLVAAGATTNTAVISSDFGISVAGLYVPAFANNIIFPANVTFSWNFALQAHWV